jgi:hypothetical protein
MVDPWLQTIDVLICAFAVPAISWPAGRTRRVVAADDPADDEPLTNKPHTLCLPRLGRSATDSDILAALIAAGGASAPMLAEALHVHRQTAWQRLQRLEGAGLVLRAGGAWQAARVPHV